MDIEKPTQRKTVQWNTQEIKTNIIDHHQDFKKKVLEFETKKSQMHDESQNSCSDDDSIEHKSQKTIEMEKNLKKAKINRISLTPGAALNLKQINRKISVKENIFPMDEEQQMEEEMMSKRAEFEKKKAKMCNESFPMRKNH